MNTLHEGTLTTALATIVASGMILITGSSIADSETNTIQPTNDGKNIEAQINVLLAPPPGPFLNEAGLVVETKKIQQLLATPKAPIEPLHRVSKPVSPIAIVSPKAAPLQPAMKKANLNAVSSKPKMPFAPLEPSFVLNAQDAPKLPQIKNKAHFSSKTPVLIPAPKLNVFMPVLPKNTIKKPIINSINQHPIWLQQNNAMNHYGMNKKTVPATNNNMVNAQKWMNQRRPVQVPNRVRNYPVQPSMYIPVPMMPSNYAAPQMPVFNGGGAPSNYWIPTPMMQGKQYFPNNSASEIKGNN